MKISTLARITDLQVVNLLEKAKEINENYFWYEVVWSNILCDTFCNTQIFIYIFVFNSLPWRYFYFFVFFFVFIYLHAERNVHRNEWIQKMYSNLIFSYYFLHRFLFIWITGLCCLLLLWLSCRWINKNQFIDLYFLYPWKFQRNFFYSSIFLLCVVWKLN